MKKRLLAVGLLALLLLTLAGSALAQSGLSRQRFEWIIAKKLTVAGATLLNSDVDLNGNKLDLDADDDTSITADTDDQIDFEVGGADVLQISVMGPVLTEGTVQAVSAAGSITPTTGYQPITSTAAVTASATTAIISGTLTGQLTCIVNENITDTIIIPDAANTNLSGAASLGPDDTLCILWDGADWLELSQANN